MSDADRPLWYDLHHHILTMVLQPCYRLEPPTVITYHDCAYSVATLLLSLLCIYLYLRLDLTPGFQRIVAQEKELSGRVCLSLTMRQPQVEPRTGFDSLTSADPCARLVLLHCRQAQEGLSAKMGRNPVIYEAELAPHSTVSMVGRARIIHAPVTPNRRRL